MCAHHDDLNDDLSDIFGDASTFAKKALSNATSTVTYEDKCAACSGSGRFRSYTGRIVGDCFKCKGKGILRYKQSPEQREKARVAAGARRKAAAAETASKADTWLEGNPAEASWLREASAKGFDFATDMLASLSKWGAFTEKQEAAVRRGAANSAIRQAEWAARDAALLASAPTVDIARIEVALAAATASGLAWPKLRLADFVFSPAGASSRNAGAIYVKGHDGLYLGKIAGGKFARSRDCTDALEAGILAAAADPLAAAVAYGHQTGSCSCCGRKLTNKESVELGIGPICRDKWGF